MFTQQHFEAVAEILRDSAATHCDQGIADLLVSRFSAAFKADNARFNPSRFTKACTLLEEIDDAGLGRQS